MNSIIVTKTWNCINKSAIYQLHYLSNQTLIENIIALITIISSTWKTSNTKIILIARTVKDSRDAANQTFTKGTVKDAKIVVKGRHNWILAYSWFENHLWFNEAKRKKRVHPALFLICIYSSWRKEDGFKHSARSCNYTAGER